MEKKSIITGKTLEEAKANVTAQLGLDADSYSYQVVQMPKSGFLGFGAQPAKIEVTYEVPDPVPEAPKVALSSASRSKPKPVAKKPEAPKVEAPKAEAPAKKTSLNASVAPENFDWDAFEGGSEIYGGEDKKSIEDAYDQTLSKIVENEVVEGTVTAISKREVIVNIGYKSEGVIQAPEFRYNPDLKVGDKVEVYVESAEDKKGQLILSHKKARALKSWDRVNEAFNNDEIVKGFVKTRTKGGMIVDVFGIEAFLPGSQIDIKPIRDYDAYVNQTMDFKIVKINQEFRNVVVSHKALLEAEQEQRRAELISKLEKGQILEGTVKNITNYGVFVDLGGVDGLIHITDLSWGRIDNPEEVVSLDQKIKVVVKEFDPQQKRIALGYKQLTPHPWDNLDANIKEGDVVKGKVVLIADYGAFVEIEPGVEGLIHVSEMSWSPRLHSAQEFLKVGDEVEAKVLSIDRENRKMSLGLKQLTPNPWDAIEEKYPVGSVVEGTIASLTDKGANIKLEGDDEGFAFSRDLIKEDGKQAVVGETLPFKVIELRRSTRRILLSHVRTYAEAKAEKVAVEADNTKKAVKKINSNLEKTTLGDISELAALKDKLEKGE